MLDLCALTVHIVLIYSSVQKIADHVKIIKKEMLSGFGNHFESESIEGALPRLQNNPQKCQFELIAEQLSGSAFTAPRASNLRSWLYRRHPSVRHSPFKLFREFDVDAKFVTTPEQMRWSPFKIKEGDFIDGLRTLGTAGDPMTKNGLSIHIYSMTRNMTDQKRALQVSDGDWLIVPQLGSLKVVTEFGTLLVDPEEILIVPRGIKISVDFVDDGSGSCRGYILEVFNGHFELPDLGPIGANGLANPHHFLYPEAQEFDVHKY